MLFIFSSVGIAQEVWPPPNGFPTRVWNGSVSSNYMTEENWTPNGEPGYENIIITFGKKHSPIIIPAFRQVYSLTLEPGVQFNATTLSVGDGGYIWLQSDPANDLFSNLTTSEPDKNNQSDFYGSVKVEAGCSLKANFIIVFRQTNITLESTSKTYSSVMINNITFSQGAQEAVKIVYKLYTNKIGTNGVKGGNDLISAPLLGKFDAAFVTANKKLPQHPTNKGEYAFAPYNVIAGAFQNFYINPNNGASDTESIPFVPGKGYRAATEDGSSLTFSGFPNIKPVAIQIFNGPEDKGNGWNLIGNPYPTYLKFEEFFNVNIDNFETNYQAVYGYNSSEGYTPWNLANTDPTTLITPGQGFFVKAKPNVTSTVNFTRAMRTTGTSDDFIVGRPANENKALSNLKLSSGSNTALTSVYFIEGSTRGIDPGYDAGVFSDSTDDFSIFTNLVESNSAFDLAIQSLPYSDFNNITVPLGIKAKAGIELSISIDDLSTLPTDINVYLEDTQNNSFTLLNDGVYTFKPTADLNNADRFNLHYSSKTLSLENVQSNDNLQIYTTVSPKTVVIKGSLTKAATANLYDIQGRLVMSKILNPNNDKNTMDISNVGTGIYLVKIKNDNEVKTQKIIIK